MNERLLQQSGNMKTKVLFAVPPLLYRDNHCLSFQPPLNLVHLYSFLKARGCSVRLLDASPLNDAVAQITRLAPDFVGISLYHASLTGAFQLVSRLKHQLPGVKLIAGGPSLTMEPERMMIEGGFDFGVIGEGEETLLELLSTTGQDAAWGNISGLAFRRGETVFVNGPRSPIADLDVLPLLDYSSINMEHYFATQLKAGIPRTVFLNSSRGCSFRCTYCCTPVLWPGRVRRYSPSRLVAEVQSQKTTFPGVDIGFCDDSFFSDREWLQEFMKLVKPLAIHFQCIGRADHLTTEMMIDLVDAGMTYLAFGVETGCSSRQSRLRKNLNLSLLPKVMIELTRLGVTTKCFFMLGFPDETFEEMAETINLASTLKRSGMTSFSIFPVTIYPGTELAKEFPHHPFCIGLDAHLPEIIRDGLGIDEKDTALLDRPYNTYLSQRQMAALIIYAWKKVEEARSVNPPELERVVREAGKRIIQSKEKKNGFTC